MLGEFWHDAKEEGEKGQERTFLRTGRVSLLETLGMTPKLLVSPEFPRTMGVGKVQESGDIRTFVSHSLPAKAASVFRSHNSQSF